MTALAQTVLFVLAAAAIAACSFGLIFFAGAAMNRARAGDLRRRYLGLALMCLSGIVAAAGLGFVAIPAMLYLAPR